METQIYLRRRGSGILRRLRALYGAELLIALIKDLVTY